MENTLCKSLTVFDGLTELFILTFQPNIAEHYFYEKNHFIKKVAFYFEKIFGIYHYMAEKFVVLSSYNLIYKG